MSERICTTRLVRPVALALAATLLLSIPNIVGARPAGETSPLLSGRATVIDGDTLEIAGERVRLEGIDAPETEQTCEGGWFGTWKCGRAATEQLRWLVGGRRVDCSSTGRDKYDRVLGWCSVDGRDVNAEMVRSGHAWAFVKYSTRYQDTEAEARRAKIGIWKGNAEPPWVFRERRWEVAEAGAPQGCAIKGNITENGHIYHMPWSPWYAKVKVEPEKGERWFCTEAEAGKAGFRPIMGP
ncbi:thermonuclease family protein [Hyphomicrobium sp.]|uniref:thermonuclease family protein n=1 Tax=Hyphomicrobium sp. TaxID=82 RepID=UPI002E30E2E9|nr:thermonuclease family protein [Hyphomicrobium sp.]HEX2843390.1 thermonuclease family protein [Hyphomicrobium sp.]